MLRKQILALFAAVGAGAALSLVGCGGPDNTEAVKAAPTAKDTLNPDVEPAKKEDMRMDDDPKRMKGRGPG